MVKGLVGLVQRLLRRDDTQLKLLLLATLIATVGFAFPRLVWATYIGYSLIALLLTQVMVGSSNAPNWSDGLYRGLGLMAVMTRDDHVALAAHAHGADLQRHAAGPELERAGGLERDSPGDPLRQHQARHRGAADGCHCGTCTSDSPPAW